MPRRPRTPSTHPRRSTGARLARVGLGLFVGLSVACSSESEPAKPSGERTREVVPETPKDAPSGPFAAFDFADAGRRWQGAWLVGVGSEKAAWHVEGERLVIAHADGREQALRFAIYSPCQVALTNEEAGETTYWNFVFAGDQLHVGLGALGRAMADSIVVCDGEGNVHVLAGEVCSRWSEMFDDWKRQPGKCRIEGEGSERRFVVGETRLEFVGEVLLAPDMRERVASWHADFEAAKQALVQPSQPSQPSGDRADP